MKTLENIFCSGGRQLPRKSALRKAVFIAFPLLSACTTAPSLATPVQAMPDHALKFQGLRATKTGRGLLVTGIVRRKSSTMLPLWGHLHVSAILVKGSPVSVDTRWSGNLLGRSYRSTTFSALLPGLQPEDVQTIVVTYRSRADSAEDPTHDGSQH